MKAIATVEGDKLILKGNSKSDNFNYPNVNWQLVRLFKNDCPVELWVGLSTQSPIGNGTSVIFEEYSSIQSSITDFRMGN